jgi:hypothetical protein
MAGRVEGAYKGWQPKEPAPIIKYLKEEILHRRQAERE